MEILDIKIEKYLETNKLLKTFKIIKEKLDKSNLETLDFDIIVDGKIMSGYNNYKLTQDELDILKNMKVKNFSYVGFFEGITKYNKNGKNIGNPKIIKFLKEAKYIKKVLESEPGNIILYEKENGKIIVK